MATADATPPPPLSRAKPKNVVVASVSGHPSQTSRSTGGRRTHCKSSHEFMRTKPNQKGESSPYVEVRTEPGGFSDTLGVCYKCQYCHSNRSHRTTRRPCGYSKKLCSIWQTMSKYVSNYEQSTPKYQCVDVARALTWSLLRDEKDLRVAPFARGFHGLLGDWQAVRSQGESSRNLPFISQGTLVR